MFRKIILSLVVLIFIVGVVFLYLGRNESLKTQLKEPEDFKFGLITGLGGLGDRGFNDMQFSGMIAARQNYGINFDYVFPRETEEVYSLVNELVRNGCNVIIYGGGYYAVEPLDNFSEKYPDVLFVILDDFAKNYRKNIASITFKQNEGSFLVGALAGLMTKTNSISMVAGKDIPVVRDFYKGYLAGAKYVNDEIVVKIDFIANYDEDRDILPWANPERAFKISEDLFNTYNTDIIFTVAGASGIGVINFAKDNNLYVIGVDSDQDHLAQGTILTSMMKNLDVAVNFIVKEIISNDFQNKPYTLGLAENGVSTSPMTYTKDIIPSVVIEKIQQIRDLIISGELSVPSVYD